MAADHAARALVPHVYRRERTAVASCAVFARSAETERRVGRLAALIDQDRPPAEKRIGEMAVQRAAELGVKSAPVAPGDAEKRAGRLVPAWETGKRLTSINGAMTKVVRDPTFPVLKIQAALVSAMAKMRARGDSELRIMGLGNAPATWVDGSRSILDIANAMAVEYMPISVDALEAYFRAFEKAGAMRIVEK